MIYFLNMDIKAEYCIDHERFGDACSNNVLPNCPLMDDFFFQF